jgi:8-oxo-dGTP pyrophosphatase MutT (NUDIX family)
MKIDKIFSCGIVPVRFDAGDWRLLVLRAYNHWDFPKGLAEANEDPLACAQRETLEETGLTDLEFIFGEEFRETAPYAGNKVARYYVAETRTADIVLPVSAALGRPEHNEWRWVTCEEAEDLLPPRLAAVLEWVHRVINEDSGGARDRSA